MRFSTAFVFASLAAAVNAHFQLQFPAPRGVFVEDEEPNFCDGYNTAVTNRTSFPLTGGFFSLNSEHPLWTATALISTAQNPTSFDNFSQAIPFFQLTGEGIFCIPLNLDSTNVTGLTDGQNVTLQIEFSGGDGSLFQCADLTLSSNASVSGISCTNATGTSTTTSSTSTSTSASSSSSSSGAVGMTAGMAGYVFGIMGLAGAALTLL